MDRFAVVTKVGHGFAQGHSGVLGAFGPGIAIAVQGDSLDAEASATLAELRCSDNLGLIGKPKEKRTSLGKLV